MSIEAGHTKPSGGDAARTAEHDSRAPNHLAGETSPYLLQHARNPVDWYPWGEPALARARAEGRPILLSIGYAACHWCHVMERESFENEATAALMNEHFVCIKVDREERPDLDEIYMAATVSLTGSGGWPMTVFLTPDAKPFFAGTYFPPHDMMGRPGFPRLLGIIAGMWHDARPELLAQAEKLAGHVAQLLGRQRPGPLAEGLLLEAVRELEASFDARHGGFGRAPKFPAPHSLELLLRHHRRTGDANALEMVTKTLDAMADGGIYDQLAGGFARYSVDERWLVPHFEKMLYDNAQLARLYADAFVVTGRVEYARIARETLDYLLREMQAPEGGFYSSTDADSEGEEGKYFVWTAAEIATRLPAAEARAVCAAFGVTAEGNWEGVTVLHRPASLEEVAAKLEIAPAELGALLERGRRALLAARAERVPPPCDDKLLASWNGLVIGALATGARVLAEPRYLGAASAAAELILTKMTRADGRLSHSYRAGRARDESFLEDYAFVADGLLDLADAVAEPDASRWRAHASRLAERMVTDFTDPHGGGFFGTPAAQPTPVVRAREALGGPLPSPSAVAARALRRLASLFDRADWRAAAEAALEAQGGAISGAPHAFPSSLVTLDLLLEGPVEVILVGASGEPGYDALERELERHYLPNRLVVRIDAQESRAAGGSTDPMALSPALVAGKQRVDGRPAAYVCRRGSCLPPVTEPGALGELLAGTRPASLA